jgi:hypothetical protein
MDRYENGRNYTEFTRVDSNTVKYTYGFIGFGMTDPDAKGTLTEKEYRDLLQTMLQDGYIKADEVPVSEGNNKDADELLDWMSRIVR